METKTLIGARVRRANVDPGTRTCTEIDPVELRALSAKYGNPVYRCYDIEADEHLRRQRWRPVPDRRGEVVFAIRQPGGEILLHTKSHYEEQIYRLPSGGIHLDESVESALFREIAEETGQSVVVRRFVGLFRCRFHADGTTVYFCSYIFYLESQCDTLTGTASAEISGFRLVAPEQLATVALALRAIRGKRERWGYWRSLPHDLIYRYLTCPPEGR